MATTAAPPLSLLHHIRRLPLKTQLFTATAGATAAKAADRLRRMATIAAPPLSLLHHICRLPLRTQMFKVLLPSRSPEFFPRNQQGVEKGMLKPLLTPQHPALTPSAHGQSNSNKGRATSNSNCGKNNGVSSISNSISSQPR